MRTPSADRPRSVSPPGCPPTPRTRREARELARSARHRRGAHRPTPLTDGAAPRSRREARGLAASHRRRTRARVAGATLLGIAAPTLAAAVVTSSIVGLPDRVSAGPPAGVAQAGADTWVTGSLASALDRDRSIASRGATSRMSLTQGLEAAAAGRDAMTARLTSLDASLTAGVETTSGGQALAREIAIARAFHEPVLDAHQTSSFGWRWGRMHNGIDFGAGHGAPLYAVGQGTVTTAGWNSGLGYHVKITLDTGETVVYGHLSRITTNVEDRVVAGSPVGAVGSTGRSTGAHLHFEVRTQDGPVDPEPWLAARRG